MEIINNKITVEELTKMAQSKFGNMVKAVIDIKLGIMVVEL